MTFSANSLILKSKANKQTGWLALLTTESPKEAEKLIKEYPWLEEIYKEAAMLRQKPEEVLGMFSEALRILDQNTIKYMIEELQKEVEEKSTLLEEKNAALKEKDFALKKKDAALKATRTELSALKKQLEQYRNSSRKDSL